MSAKHIDDVNGVRQALDAGSAGNDAEPVDASREVPVSKDRPAGAEASPEASGADRPLDAASTEIGGGVSADLELRSLQDRFLRQAAEFQNFRRRVEQERRGDVKFGESIVLQEMLDVYDDLRRSIEAAEEAAEQAGGHESPRFQALLDGVELVYRKFTEVLQRFGVEPIEAVGELFNEHEHEAMMQQPAPEGTKPGTVLGEVQKGYRMGDRVLRHSKVVVSS